MFFESLAFAMGGNGQGGASAGPEAMFMQFLPLILMIAVFWFLLIRPQKKRQQEHKNMLEALRRGDTVVTTGGIIGRIVDIDGDVLTLDLGETKARVGRGFVSGLFDGRQPQALKEKKGKSESREARTAKNAENNEPDNEAPEERKEEK